MPSSTYAAYEDEKKFKKRQLPLDLTRRIAEVLVGHGVDRGDVMALAGVAAAGGELTTPNEVAKSLGLSLIPELELGYSMGGGSIFADYRQTGFVPFQHEWLRTLMRGSVSDLFVARGEGDSMQPTLLDGDVVLVDTAQKNITQQDRIWAVAWGDLGMIKRVRRTPGGTYQLLSDNASVSTIEAADEEMHVVGRVIWIGRRI